MPDRVFAEFSDSEHLATALRELGARGLTGLEAYTPYSTHSVRSAIGKRRSRLSIAIGVGGFAGAAFAYFLEWWMVAEDYPLNVGGRPPHFPLAFVPIAFEMGVLTAAFTAFFGVLILGRLVKLHDPVFEVEGFETSTVGGFWLAIPLVSEAPEIEDALRGLGALYVVRQPGGTP